jgi:aminoglycoside phosphotransferase (APT) family kinase protein
MGGGKVSHDLDDVAAFLADLHGGPVRGLEPLAGGFWSSAFAYEVDGRELVLRLGSIRQGFEMDRAARAFNGPGLPVPEVLDVGDAFGGAYAVSVRHHGRFLQEVAPEEADVLGPTLAGLLAALRRVQAPLGASVAWFDPDTASRDVTWRQWVADRLVDDPGHVVSGWRPKIAADPELDQLFTSCEGRIGELLDACPERRDLVHGDLLYSNVLLTEDASAVNGVFSWKCSVRGDFLYDVALCTFWGPWHPGIAATDIFTRVVTSPDLSEADRADAALRHHCYELQIGAHHLGWNVWRGDDGILADVAAHTAMILERGPL